MKKKLTDELIQEIQEYYKTKPMGLKDIEEKFGISHPLACKALKGIPRYPKNLIFNPNLKEDYFETIDSEDKAYFLGFIIGDGNVFTDYCKDGYSAMVSITVNEEDVEILEMFKQQTQVQTAIGKDGRGALQSIIRSNKMAKDLEKYGIIPRKTFKTYLPLNVPENQMRNLIRGICDSDGSIGAQPLKNNPNKFNHWISFCGTKRLMEDISNYCYNKLDLTKRSTVYEYSNKNLSETRFKNIEDMYTVGMWLYDNSNFFLKRKKNKFIEFCKHYNKPIPR